MANSPDSPELIGGSFALGQWLADHDPSFKNLWNTWCSEIESVQGVAQDDSVTLEAIVEVVRDNDVEKEGRKLLFKYAGPGAVNPLKISVEGNELLEQAYALAAATQSFDESTVVPLPEAQVTVVTLPTIGSRVTRLPPIAPALSMPEAHSEVVLPQRTASPGVVPPKRIVEAQTAVPQRATSATTMLPVGASKPALVTLPEVAQPIVRVAVIKESASSPLPSAGETESKVVTLPEVPASGVTAAVKDAAASPLPSASATESKVATLPEAPKPVVTVAVIPASATEAVPLPSAKPSESEIVIPPAAPDRTVAPITIPETERAASTLPKPTPLAIVNLPEKGKADLPAVVIPKPTASETTLPSPGQIVSAGQYLVPIEPFPSGVSVGKTLAEVIEGVVGKGVMPAAVSEVLGHLKVRKGFLALSGRFKGLVLEVEMDSPVTALVRMSLAKEKNVWAFGGEVIIARGAKEGKPRPPLIFTLKIASGSTSKSLAMALEGEVDLIDDLFRPMFGDFSIPDKIGLTVKNPVLVIVKKNEATKALVGVSLAMSVDFGELPFVGEAIKAEGAAKLSLGIQYAAGSFIAAEVADINSVLSSELQFAAPESGTLEGLKLAASLQMTGKPLLLSIPLGGGKPSDQLQTPPETVGTTEGETKPTKPKTDEMMKWIEVNKSLGPVHLDKVGIGYADGAVQLRISGGVEISGLSFFVEGLGAGVLLAWPPETPTFNLDGLGLVLNVPPVSVSAALLRTKIDGVDSYDGLALIKAANFTIMGLGSYSVVGDQPSLFMFAVLHAELGGPPCFRVNGLAVGFGYHRKFKLPPIEEVQNFPLVRGALEENYLNPPGVSTQVLIRNAMEKLREYIPPSKGDYWFAAGVRFSSFEMLQSFALLSVSFGHQVEIGLLGMSKLTIPKGAEPGKAVAYAELAIRAVVNPDQGIISVEGRLTDKSYIFTQDCHLTGGFAFYLWLKDQPPAAGATEGAKGGDFVLTLGGYHPRFVRPAHYPIVPRLGINWQVSSQLTIKAEMYFALTPSCLMTGGKLSAVFQTSCIKAWFTAFADLLLSWKPFYYLVDIGISIGVEAKVEIPLGFATITISIRVELSVELHLWGPPFAGEAIVDLTVISFTIPFGPDKEPPPPLKAPEFVHAFLPPAKSPPPVIVVRINNGLLTQREKNNEVLRVVNAHQLSLTAESLIPSTSFAGLAESARYKEGDIGRPDLGSTFGIRPMAKQTLNSLFRVNLLRGDEIVVPRNLRATFVENGVPDALWGRCEVEGQVTLPGAPAAKTIKATAGILFSFLPIDPAHALFPIPLAKLKFEQLPTKKVVWQDLGEAQTIPAPGNNTFWNTIWNNDEVNARRDAILDVLKRQSPFAMNTPKLERLQKSERDYFQADPEFATLGEQLK